MSVNRFDRTQGQQYVSTYVPLPLENIGRMAHQYSQQYKAGQEIPHQLDALDQALKVAPVDFKNKASVLDEYHKQMNDLVENAKPDDYAKPEFQQKATRIINTFKNDPRVNAMTNNKEVFDKVYTPYLNSKESKEDLVLTNVLDKDNPEKGYKAHSSGYKQMQPGQSLAPLDYIKFEKASEGAKRIMDDIKIDGKSLSGISQWNKDNDYFLNKDSHQKYILEDKVRGIARNNIGNYAENSEGKFRFKKLLNQVGLDPHMSYSEFKYSDNIPDNLKQAVDSELENDLFNYASKQIFSDTDTKYTLKGDELALHAGKKKIDDAVDVGMGQPIPGRIITEVVPDDIKQFMDKNGKFDFTSMGKDIPVYGPNGILMSLKPGDMAGDAKKVASFVMDAAKAIGYDKEIKADNYNDILEKYNSQLNKVAPDYAMTSVESEVISHSVKTQRNNYEFLDENGEKLTDNIALDKTFSADQKIIRKIGDKNVVMYKGSYVPEGEDKPKVITVRPLGVQTNIANDRVADQQNRAIQWLSKGAVDEQIAPVQQAAVNSGLISEGFKVIDFQPDIIRNGIGYVTIGNEGNRSKQGIIKVAYTTEADGSLKFIAQDKKQTSPTEFMNEQFKAYYSTPQGIAELQPIMGSKKKLGTTNSDLEE